MRSSLRHVVLAITCLTGLFGTTELSAMYDPLTGRFMQRDPSGYPDGMNAYGAYHVMRGGLDPTGRVLTIQGSDEFKENTTRQLEQAAELDDRIKNMIDDIKESKHEHVIKEVEDIWISQEERGLPDIKIEGALGVYTKQGGWRKEWEDVGTDAVLEWDPDATDPTGAPGDCPDPEEPDPKFALVTLTHELSHVWSIDRGLPRFREGRPSTEVFEGSEEQSNSGAPIPVEEQRGVQAENIARDALELQRRTKYEGFPLPDPSPDRSPLSANRHDGE